MTWKWWDSLSWGSLIWRKLLKDEATCPYAFISLLHFYCPTLKILFQVKFLLDLELYQPFLGSIWFKLSPLSSLCYPFYFPRLGLRAIYISAASTSMYTTCLAQVNISFLFTELKFIEHLLCSRQCTKEMRARWAVLLSSLLKRVLYLTYPSNSHSSAHCSVEF